MHDGAMKCDFSRATDIFQSKSAIPLQFCAHLLRKIRTRVFRVGRFTFFSTDLHFLTLACAQKQKNVNDDAMKCDFFTNY